MLSGQLAMLVVVVFVILLVAAVGYWRSRPQRYSDRVSRRPRRARSARVV